MYQSTAIMVTYLNDKLIEKGLSVKPHNVTEVDMGELAMSSAEASTVVFSLSHRAKEITTTASSYIRQGVHS